MFGKFEDHDCRWHFVCHCRKRFYLSKNLTLKSVLYFPNLACDLFSVRKLTMDSDCTAQFSHSCCKLQDMHSEMTISSGKEVDGLYYFDE